MATDESTPRWSTEDRTLLRTAAELLKAGEYERLAELLDRLRSGSDRERDPIAAHTLDLARRISLACSQSQAEAEWHQQACKEAAQRQDELRHQLNSLLHLDGTGEESAPAPELSSPVEPPSIVQRLQGLVRRRPEPQPAEEVAREAPVLPVEVRAPALEEPEPEPQAPEKAGREARVPSVEVSAPALQEPEPEPAKDGEEPPPALVVYCLGQFRVYQEEHPVEDWPSGKGKAIFKYLVTHRQRPVVKEVLMELFWPGAHPDAARNNLNVAIYGLRQALRATRPDFSHVLFQDDCYLLNPDLPVWIDAEEFGKHFKLAQEMEQRGDQAAAIREYHAAEALYDGEFLEEDRYEDWLIPRRQRYQDDYLKLLDCLSRCYLDSADYSACVTMCRKMLTVDRCREEAHRRLMRCYSQQGQAYLALRQYHICVNALKSELDVSPTQKTQNLYDQIQSGVGRRLS